MSNRYDDVINKTKLINQKRDKIYELEDFLYVAKKVWAGKLVIEKQKYLLKTVPYGIFEEKTITLDTDIKNEILQFIENKIESIKKEIEDIYEN